MNKGQIKLTDSFHRYLENIDVILDDYKTNCFVLEIGDKKIAIDNQRINVYQTAQECETSFDIHSQNLFYIKDDSILGFSEDIDDLFSYYNYSYIFSIDDQMNLIYYDEFDDYGKGILKLISSIAASNFEIIRKANLESLNSLLYYKKENDQVYLMFEPIEDLVEYAAAVMSEKDITNHNKLWNVIDEFEITSIAEAYFKKMVK